MKRILFFILILTGITACEEVYEAPPLALVQATFLDSATKLTLTSKVTVVGEGLDSLWVYETSMSEIKFPLSVNDTTNYFFSFDSTIDTISFIHETKQTYESMETGFYYEYKLLTIESTFNRIDSIQITDSLVTQNWHENIKLYIRPLPAGSN